MSRTPLACGPTLRVAGEDVRLLALVCDRGGEETYLVAIESDGHEREAQLRHTVNEAWELTDGSRRTPEVLGTPNEVFARALGACTPFCSDTTPHWPLAVTQRLTQRGLVGAGVIAFDAAWFLATLSASAMDVPMLFPNAASKLDLGGLQHATELLQRRSGDGLISLLMQALEPDDWDGEGRLIGAFPTGELAQLGNDLSEGCNSALGTGPLAVVFAGTQPLGLGLGVSESGVWVGEVDPGGAAEQAGVTVGMVIRGLSGSATCPHGLDAVLDAIDRSREGEGPMTIAFDTASVATHLYAVEMPADLVLAALGDGTADPRSLPALCGDALLWHEQTARLFIGEGGAMTCAHTDICPQLQLAHGLLGSKVLGVATHAATARLSGSFGGDDDPATVPTDRPLSSREASLLEDDAIALIHLQPGDLAVFDSGALHFASHGVDGLNSALYQGIMTPGAMPRLRSAAAASTPAQGAYRDHLTAADLLRLIEG